MSKIHHAPLLPNAYPSRAQLLAIINHRRDCRRCHGPMDSDAKLCSVGRKLLAEFVDATADDTTHERRSQHRDAELPPINAAVTPTTKPSTGSQLDVYMMLDDVVDKLHDAMDAVWYRLTDAERATAERSSRSPRRGHDAPP